MRIEGRNIKRVERGRKLAFRREIEKREVRVRK